MHLITAIICMLMTMLVRRTSCQTEVGFYRHTCPKAEEIVSSVVMAAVRRNPRNAPILLRLQFHDCFVDGCDGSILADNGDKSESLAVGHLGVEGFEVIDMAKSKLEAACKGVVSCADIIALAARDAVSLSNGPFYQVPTGRRDGHVSDVEHATNMPEVDDSIATIKKKFLEKGLSEKDLVLLTAGAHTIGTTACFFMQKRLYNFSTTTPSDPAINPKFLGQLKERCPFQGDLGKKISLDPSTNNTFDPQSLFNLRKGIAVLASDARLMDDAATREVVEFYLSSPESFEKDFVQAILKMGLIQVKTGHGEGGEIRTLCSHIDNSGA